MPKRILNAQIIGIIKAIVCCRKIGQEPGRNIDMVKAMVKAMAGMTLSGDIFSNKHKTNSLPVLSRTLYHNTTKTTGL